MPKVQLFYPKSGVRAGWMAKLGLAVAAGRDEPSMCRVDIVPPACLCAGLLSG